MILYELLPRLFVCALASLAGLSLAPALPKLSRLRELVAILAANLAVLTGFIVFLKALYAVASRQPYSYLVFFMPFRGQYAWTYWAYFLALVLAQTLWIPAIRRRPRVTLTVAILCLIGAMADRLALLLWGSH